MNRGVVVIGAAAAIGNVPDDAAASVGTAIALTLGIGLQNFPAG